MKQKTKPIKGALHPRNKHHGQYDFSQLVKACPELGASIISNPRGQASINFADANSVLLLNKALLAYFYQIHFWQIPTGYLCPPIPGRVDYIHYIADLLIDDFSAELAIGSQIKGLDIGCGASCIYPILGSRSYGWSFVAADIDSLAIKTANLLVNANANISKKVTTRQQTDSTKTFTGLIKKTDRFAFSMCNPPFHASMQEATAGSLLKQKNLTKNAKTKSANKEVTKPTLNFAGQAHELSCKGGEIAFVKQMVEESLLIKHQVCWFTCLLSKSENVKPIKQLLEKQKVQSIKVIEMSQGHKISRFIAWSYLSKQQRQSFINTNHTN